MIMRKSLFDKILTAYLQERPLFYAFLRPQEALFYQRYLPLKSPSLDFGCGDGFFARQVLLGGKRKIDVGLDIDKRVKKQAESSGVYRQVVIYDGEKIPFADGYFYSVMANCVLEHIPYLEETMAEICRVMKKGGRMYLTVVTDQWPQNLLGGKIFGRFYRSWFNRIQRHFNLLSEHQWKQVFAGAGFEVEKSFSYFNAREQAMLEIFHYLSFYSILLKKLLGRWSLIKNLPFSWLVKIFFKIKPEIADGNHHSCLFFLLRKR